MYRFQGQAKDEEGNELVYNYICFGTSDLKECTANQDKYMYRIIGIEAETGRVKVIKKEALEDTYQWWDDYHTNIKLPNSLFFTKINGEDFLKNETYVPAGWEEKISNNAWTYGDMLENDSYGATQLGEGLYQTEIGRKQTRWLVKSTEADGGIEGTVEWKENTESYGKTVYSKEVTGKWEGEEHKVTSKISLMYLHDYYLSVSDTAICNYYAEGYEKCKTGWIHLSNNDDPQSIAEWTMSRLGWWASYGAFLGWSVRDIGNSSSPVLTQSLSVRPVFYLASVNQLLGGRGTSDDPFIIKTSN